MRQFIAPTEDFIKVERTRLAADATAGSNVTLTLENNDQIVNTDFIVIGHEGGELAELETVNQAVSGSTQVRVATLKFNHKAGEPVTKYRYNKRKFYGSLTETGSYTEITADGSPIAIQVDDPQGTVFEYTGNEGYAWFKSTYYNSNSPAIETDIADSIAVPADQSARYTSIYAIRKHAGIQGNPYYSDERVEAKRKQAENEINSALYALYVLPLAEVPALIQRVCELLAAGYIDYEEFGGDGQGVKWLGEARGILKAIAEGRQRLIGSDGEQLQEKTLTQGVQSYPDGVDNDNGPVRVFTMTQKF